MSLNEKYIINGDTLSDIGDALRAKSIIAPTKEVTQQVCCYRDNFTTSRDNYGNYKNTTTLTEWDIQYWYGINWDYPVPQFSYVRIYRETNNYSMKVNGSTLAAGSSVIVSLPVTLLFEGNYTCYVKFYPLDSNQNEIPWDSSYYYPWNPNDYNVHYYKENITKQVPNLIAVEDIATAISEKVFESGANVVGISPFTLANLESKATDVSAYISDIDDIVDFYFSADPSNGFWYRIKPVQSEKTTLTSGAGNGKISYPVKQYNYGSWSTPPANWESSASNSGMRVFFSNGKLVVTGSYSYTNYYMPAILIYK